jgi:lysozyme
MDSMLIDACIPVLSDHEGRDLHVYPDSLGIKTIGVGFNLEQPGARETIEKMGADYDALLAGTADLTDEQCDSLLTQCIISNVEWLVQIFPDFSTYSLGRRVTLVDMSFMGESHFKEFTNMIASVRAKDWYRAAEEALDSKWARQVGKRSTDDAQALREG